MSSHADGPGQAPAGGGDAGGQRTAGVGLAASVRAALHRVRSRPQELEDAGSDAEQGSASTGDEEAPPPPMQPREASRLDLLHRLVGNHHHKQQGGAGAGSAIAADSAPADGEQAGVALPNYAAKAVGGRRGRAGVLAGGPTGGGHALSARKRALFAPTWRACCGPEPPRGQNPHRCMRPLPHPST